MKMIIHLHLIEYKKDLAYKSFSFIINSKFELKSYS